MSEIKNFDLEESKKKRKKWIFLLIKGCIALLVLGWIAWKLSGDWQKIAQYDWNFRFGWIGLSGLFYLAGFFPAAVYWFLSLRWLGQRPSFGQVLIAYYVGQLGKYVPGKALVVVIRAGMVRSEKCRASVAALCVFLETLTMMSAGALAASLMILFFFRQHWFYSVLALGMTAGAGLPIFPPVFRWIVKKIGLAKKNPDLLIYLDKWKFPQILTGFLLMSVGWCLLGLGLWAAVRGLGFETGSLLPLIPLFVTATALSIVLGFAIMVMPGGLGVRELVLTLFMIPFFLTGLEKNENQIFLTMTKNQQQTSFSESPCETPSKASDKISDQTSNKASGKIPDKTLSESISDSNLQNMSENNFENLSEKVFENESENNSENNSEILLENISKNNTEKKQEGKNIEKQNGNAQITDQTAKTVSLVVSLEQRLISMAAELILVIFIFPLYLTKKIFMS